MAYATGSDYYPRLGYGGSPALALNGLPVCWQPIDDGTDHPFKNVSFTPSGGETLTLDRNGSRLSFAESTSNAWSSYANSATALLVPSQPSHIEVEAGFSFSCPGALDSWWFAFRVGVYFAVDGDFVAGYDIYCGDWGAGGVKPTGWPSGGDGVYDGARKYRNAAQITASLPIPYYATAAVLDFGTSQYTPSASSVSRSLSASVYVDSGARGVLR